MKLWRYAAIRRLIIGQVCFYGFLLLAWIFVPDRASISFGISFYGERGASFIPYTFSMLLYAGFIAAAGYKLRGGPRSWRPVTIASYIFAVMLVGVWATPFTLGITAATLHVVIGDLLLVGQFVLILWATAVFRPDLINWLLLTAAWLTGLAAYLSLAGFMRLLLPAQIIYELIFTVALIRVGLKELPAAEQAGLYKG